MINAYSDASTAGRCTRTKSQRMPYPNPCYAKSSIMMRLALVLVLVSNSLGPSKAFSFISSSRPARSYYGHTFNTATHEKTPILHHLQTTSRTIHSPNPLFFKPETDEDHMAVVLHKEEQLNDDNWKEEERIQRMATILSSQLGRAFLKSNIKLIKPTKETALETALVENNGDNPAHEIFQESIGRENAAQSLVTEPPMVISSTIDEADTDVGDVDASIDDSKNGNMDVQPISKENEKPAIVPSIPEQVPEKEPVSPEPLHVAPIPPKLQHDAKMEGNRNVALKDDFSAPTEATNVSLPDVISMSFGKPLEVEASGVPPLQHPVSVMKDSADDTHPENTTDKGSNISPSSLKATAVALEHKENTISEAAGAETNGNSDSLTPLPLSDDEGTHEDAGTAIRELLIETVPISGGNEAKNPMEDPDVPTEFLLKDGESLQDTAFRLLLHLEMIEISPDPRDPHYDHTRDDELWEGNIFL